MGTEHCRPRCNRARPRSTALAAVRKFQDKEERVTQGQRAFAIAQAKGWDHVEDRVRAYKILPEAAFQNPTEAYHALLDGIGLAPLTAAS